VKQVPFSEVLLITEQRFIFYFVCIYLQEPYSMPEGFEWVSLDVRDPAQLEEVYTLLTENYVEDDDNMFRYFFVLNFLLVDMSTCSAILIPLYLFCQI
jgi:hypothetical protein